MSGNGNGNGSGVKSGKSGCGAAAKGKAKFFCYYFDPATRKWYLYYENGNSSLQDVEGYPNGALSLHKAQKSALVSLNGKPPLTLPVRSSELAKVVLTRKGITLHRVVEFKENALNQ